MFIGNFNQNHCTISSESPNKSVCITGLSGSGKTCRLNQIELENAKKGATLVVLDMNHTHAKDQIFPHIQQQFMNFENRIYAVKDGFDLCLFQPLKNKKNELEPMVHLINSAVQAFNSSQNMGVRQITALREAVIDAIKYRADFDNDAQALDFCLSMREDAQSEGVRQRLWPLLNCGALHPSSKSILPGQINILDFSEIDTLTQTALAELVLASIWRNSQYTRLDASPKNLIIVLDEFQNLSLKKDAVLQNMLREGRKFGINLVLATQTLGAFSKDILTLLEQTATKLYFRPAQNEALKISKTIANENPKEWAKKLLTLKIGESIAVGNLCVNGLHIDRPVLLN